MLTFEDYKEKYIRLLNGYHKVLYKKPKNWEKLSERAMDIIRDKEIMLCKLAKSESEIAWCKEMKMSLNVSDIDDKCFKMFQDE